MITNYKASDILKKIYAFYSKEYKKFGIIDGFQIEISYKEELNKKKVVASEVEIIISKMYDFVDFNFVFLKELSELFGTQKINVGDKESFKGCDTCDYGSCYKIKFTIIEPQILIDKDVKKLFKQRFDRDNDGPFVIGSEEEFKLFRKNKHQFLE